MRLLTMLPVIAALLVLPGELSAAPADERPEPRAISVTGSADVRAEPDRAHVTFGIEVQANTAQAAQQEANRVIQRILESLRRMNIPPRNIQTSTLTLSPVYEPRPPQPREEYRAPRIVGYRATNTLTVMVERLDQVGPVIDAAMAAGANTIQGVRFSLADDLPQRLEALRRATEEARRKAEAVAQAAGVTLGPLRTVNEQNVQVIPFFARMGGAEAARADVATPVAPGEITVQAMVNAVYDIGNPR